MNHNSLSNITGDGFKIESVASTDNYQIARNRLTGLGGNALTLNGTASTTCLQLLGNGTGNYVLNNLAGTYRRLDQEGR